MDYLITLAVALLVFPIFSILAEVEEMSDTLRTTKGIKHDYDTQKPKPNM